MDKLTINTNIMTKTPFTGNLDSDLAVLNQEIARLKNGHQYQSYDGLADLLLPDTCTMQDIFNKMVPGSILCFEALAGTHVNLDLPIHPGIGTKQSGRLLVIAADASTTKQTAYFHNQSGQWMRSFNIYAAEADRDTGWRLVVDGNFIPYITGTVMSTYYSNLSSNIRYAGKTYFTGGLAATITDLPTTTAGILEVQAISANGEFMQTYTTWAGMQKYTRALGASVGPWVKTATSNDVFTTSGRITAAGLTSTAASTMQNITPQATTTYNLGSASLVWNNIYTQNAVTVVSDRNYKDQIGEIPDEVLDAWATVNYSQWKMNSAIELKGDDDARLHVGIIAQEIKEKFEAAGLDATDYGILIHDKWDEVKPVAYQPPVYDPETDELISEEVQAVEGREAGEIWMVRMEECLALEAALMRRELNRMKEALGM